MGEAMTQVKFTIESSTVSAFKSRCASEGVSMASAIRQFMSTCRTTKEMKPKTHTRPLRRITVVETISVLNNVLDAEAAYRDDIPWQFAQRYEAADHACEMIEEAIASLEEAF